MPRETAAITSSFGRSDPTPSPDIASADRELICASWNPPCEPVLTEIEEQMDPYQEAVELLMTHPGVQAVAAMGFVSEVGIDLSRFPNAKHAGFLGWRGALYHALEYPWRSQEELERRFLGQWLTSRRKIVGNCSMPTSSGRSPKTLRDVSRKTRAIG